MSEEKKERGVDALQAADFSATSAMGGQRQPVQSQKPQFQITKGGYNHPLRNENKNRRERRREEALSRNQPKGK